MAEICKELEAAGQDESLAGAADSLGRLRAEFGRVGAAFGRLTGRTVDEDSDRG
jgi:hypothetical protein